MLFLHHCSSNYGIMFIGLISDTHGVFDPQFEAFFEPVDQIWHAGDFGGGMDLAAILDEAMSSSGMSLHLHETYVE